MNKVRLIPLIFLLYSSSSFSTLDDTLIGLTYKVSPVHCGSTSKTDKCFSPDPQGVVSYINRNDIGKVGGGKYRNSLRLSVFVSDGYSGLPPEPMSHYEVERDNLIVGSSSNLRLFAGDPSRMFEQFLMDGVRYASGGRTEEYIESVSGSVRYLDSWKCKDIVPEKLVPSESPKYSGCYSKLVVISDSNYGWAYAVCSRRYIGSDGEISRPACQVWSRVRAGVYIEYQVNDEFIANKKWIDLDKEVRKYILSIESEGGEK